MTQSAPMNVSDLALAALRLHVEYESVPRDRGGSHGPKGKAWAAFVEARDAALRASARAPSGVDRREEVAANGIAKLLRDWAGDSARVTYPALREDLIKAAGWIDGLAALLNAPQWEPTDEDVERVAVAIEQTMFAPHEFPLSDELHNKYRYTARAAIASYSRGGGE